MKCARCTRCRRGACIPIPGCEKEKEEIDRLCLTVKCGGRCTKCRRGNCIPVPGCGNTSNQTESSDAVERKRQCSLNRKTGPCRASIRSWAFDRSSKTCQPFTYGGCQGNSNRFRTERECLDRCSNIDYDPCRQVKLKAPPKDCEYVKELNPPEFCPSFRLECSNALQRCSQPKKTGPCRAAKRRFHYNRNSGSCQPFTYGGCRGNENSFKTERDCQSVCRDVPVCLPRRIAPPPPGCRYVKDPPAAPSFCPVDRLVCDNNNEGPPRVVGSIEQCSLPEESGPCEAAMTKYYFDRRRNRCEQFRYGGCDGNANRFDSEKECESACKNKFDRCPVYRLAAPPKGCTWKMVVKPPKYCPSPEANCPPIRQCSLSSAPGPCKAAIRKYYFDRSTNECKRFTYGGCRGNENRFDTMEECRETCAGKYPQCPMVDVLPAKEGCQYEDQNNPPGFCSLPVEVCPRFDPNVECRRAPSGGICEQQPVGQRYAYNAASKQCEPFSFGGCGGNRNNFESRVECQTACAGV